MNRGGSDIAFHSQLTEKRALKVICSHKNRLLTKNGVLLSDGLRRISSATSSRCERSSSVGGCDDHATVCPLDELPSSCGFVFRARPRAQRFTHHRRVGGPVGWKHRGRFVRQL